MSIGFELVEVFIDFQVVALVTLPDTLVFLFGYGRWEHVESITLGTLFRFKGVALLTGVGTFSTVNASESFHIKELIVTFAYFFAGLATHRTWECAPTTSLATSAVVLDMVELIESLQIYILLTGDAALLNATDTLGLFEIVEAFGTSFYALSLVGK